MTPHLLQPAVNMGISNPCSDCWTLCCLLAMSAAVRLTSSLKSSTVPLGLSLMWRPLDYLPRGWLQAQSDFLCAKVSGGGRW